MLTLCALEHFVVACVAVTGEVAYVGDVHNTVDLIALEAESLLKDILHDVASQVADVGVVIYGRSAGVHIYLALNIGHEFFLFV